VVVQQQRRTDRLLLALALLAVADRGDVGLDRGARLVREDQTVTGERDVRVHRVVADPLGAVHGDDVPGVVRVVVAVGRHAVGDLGLVLDPERRQ